MRGVAPRSAGAVGRVMRRGRLAVWTLMCSLVVWTEREGMHGGGSHTAHCERRVAVGAMVHIHACRTRGAQRGTEGRSRRERGS
eukprot:5321977-Prymnesium_polylepis.2